MKKKNIIKFLCVLIIGIGLIGLSIVFAQWDSRVAPREVETQLFNPITGQWETVTTGVEYYSPNQHGRIIGTIYRRYYSIPDCPGLGGSVSIPLGFTFSGWIMDIKGVCLAQSEWKFQPMPYIDFGSASRNIEISVGPPNINLAAGSGQDWQAGSYLWIDYTK